MGCTVDNLAADYRVCVVRGFRDARGCVHEAGEDGTIRRLDLDFGAGEMVIEWERGSGAREAMYFRLDSRDGPRNGHMREFFEVGEFAPQPPRAQTRPLLELDPAAARVVVLASGGRFDEARAEVLRILDQPNARGNDEQARWLAREIGTAAAAHASVDDSAVYDWLKGWCIELWYQWGSGASSGGEGTVRRGEIDAAERRFAELDARRSARR